MRHPFRWSNELHYLNILNVMPLFLPLVLHAIDQSYLVALLLLFTKSLVRSRTLGQLLLQLAVSENPVNCIGSGGIGS